MTPLYLHFSAQRGSERMRCLDIDFYTDGDWFAFSASAKHLLLTVLGFTVEVHCYVPCDDAEITAMLDGAVARMPL